MGMEMSSISINMDTGRDSLCPCLLSLILANFNGIDLRGRHTTCLIYQIEAQSQCHVNAVEFFVGDDTAAT